MKCIPNWRQLTMFDRDIRIQGIYATHLKKLAKNGEQPYIFDRYIDVYMNAAVIGLLEGEPITKPDYSVKDSAQILLDALSRERANCIFLYKLVMLLDKSSGLNAEQRIDRAFRDEGDEAHPEKIEANMTLFLGYVLAGIEIMYERIVKNNSTLEDMCDAAYEMMLEFQDDTTKITPEEFLKKYHIL